MAGLSTIIVLLVVCVFTRTVNCTSIADSTTDHEAQSLKLLKSTVPMKQLLEKAAAARDDVPNKEVKENASQLRQGWGWKSPSYSSGGYDIYSLIAVAAFGALFGALFFELAIGGSFRSLGSTFSVPFALDSEQIANLVGKVSNFISDIDWMEIVNNATEGAAKSRVLRDVSEQTGVLKWVKAYKKDPIEYQCIRKVACETLAESSLVARSMKAPFGGAVLSAVGIFIEDGEQLQSIVKDTIGNPDKCKDMAPWGFCEDDDDDEMNSD